VNQPVIDPDRVEEQVDTDGKKWVQALCDSKGRILAGYDEPGEFHCFVDSEKLFITAMAAMVHLQETR
jgi:hypothetical protein